MKFSGKACEDSQFQCVFFIFYFYFWFSSVSVSLMRREKHSVPNAPLHPEYKLPGNNHNSRASTRILGPRAQNFRSHRALSPSHLLARKTESVGKDGGQYERCECGGKQNVASFFFLLFFLQLKSASTECHYRRVWKHTFELCQEGFFFFFPPNIRKTKSLITWLTDLIMKQCRVGLSLLVKFSDGLYWNISQRPVLFTRQSFALTFFKLCCLCIAIHAWHQLPINPLSTEIHPSLRVGCRLCIHRQWADYRRPLCPHQARAQLTTPIIFTHERCRAKLWWDGKNNQ